MQNTEPEAEQEGGTVMDCFHCDKWIRICGDGEDICIATKDENDMCMVIPIDVDVPEWCPLKKSE